MYKTILLLAIFTTVVSAQDFDSLINPLWGPNAGEIYELKYNNSRDIFLSSNNGLFKSTDDGDTWKNILNNGLVYGIEINSKNELFIMACPSDLYSYQNYLYKSKNNGDSWEKISSDSSKHILIDTNNNLIFKYIWSESNDSRISIRISLSENEGKNWTQIKEYSARADTTINFHMSMNEFGKLLLITNYLKNSQYLKTNIEIFDYKSGNWDSKIFNLFQVLSINYISKDSLLSHSRQGLEFSTDGGNTWKNIFNKEIYRFFRFNDNYFISTYKNGIYYSNGNINNFTKISDTFVENIFITILGNLLISNYAFILKSTDFGNSWISSGKGFTATTISNLTINKNNNIFCNTFTNYHSTSDGGKSWLDYDYGWNKYTSSDYNGNVYLICGPLGYKLVLRSTNNGVTFDTISQPQDLPLGITRVTANRKGYVYTDPFIYRTIDNGKTWAYLCYGNNVSVNSEDYLFKTGEWGEIFRSTDDGDSWEKMNADIETADYGEGFRLLFHHESSTGYGFSGNVYKTTDNGRNWVKLDYKFGMINSAALDSAGNLFVLGPNELYIKLRWQDSFTKYKLSDIYTFLDIQAAPDGEIYLGSERGGLFRLNRGLIDGLSVEEIEPSPLFAFPNPARDYIEIDVGIGRDLSLPGNTIYVYNAIGILVLSTPVNSVDTPASGGQIKIDVSGLPPGVYFVRYDDSFTKFVKGE